MKNKFASFFSKQNKKLLTAILCLAAGVCLIFLSGVILEILLRIAGIALLAAALTGLIVTVSKEDGKRQLFAIIHYAVLILLGLILAASPANALRTVFSAIGVYILATSLIRIYKLAVLPSDAKGAGWWVQTVSSVIMLLLGFWLLFAPSAVFRITEIIAGIILLIKASQLLEDYFSLKKSDGTGQKKNGDIEADFVDKSHEL